MNGKGKAPATGLTIVIKLGTSSIVSPTYPFLPHLHLLASIVETVVRLRQMGHRVVLCSSGAIGVGLRRMGLKERGKALAQKQALAAVGQGRLIALWDNLFSQLDQPIAQILLTRNDISDRTRYLNAQNTFNELLQMGVVPIVNENDTVSVSEIKFGDNDTLSAISSAIVHADYLFLLTDVAALYTDNPRRNPEAKPVRVVRDIAAVRRAVSTATLGTSLGTGGMETKLIAADLATAAGVTTVIMHSERVGDIFGVIEGGAGPSREARGAERAGPESGAQAQAEDEAEALPLCTRFLRSGDPMRERKWWIAHGLHSAGTIVIDEGALRAIRRRESGGRLLPAGVVRVDGAFAASQAVRVVVRRRKREQAEGAAGGDGLVDGTGRATDTRGSIDLDGDQTPSTTFASRSASYVAIPPLGAAQAPTSAMPTSVNPSPQSRPSRGPSPRISTGDRDPNTPLLQPAMSLSSSIASLDPLNRSAPHSPDLPSPTDAVSATVAGSANTAGMVGSALKEEITLDSLRRDLPQEQEQEWEEVEVGKGLTHYNSVEIDRVKGMKSSHIETILGYCESEHVVDSISFY